MSIEVEQLKHRAKQAMQNGQADKAADALNQLVTIESDNIKYRQLAAEMCKRSGRQQEAAGHYWQMTKQHLDAKNIQQCLQALAEFRKLQDIDVKTGRQMFERCLANDLSIGHCLPFLHDDDRLTYAMRAHRMFDSLEDALFEEARASCTLIQAADGDVVVKEGDPGDCILIVVQGGLCPVVSDEYGESYEMAVYEPGGIAGEGAFLTKQHVRSASLVAVGETRVYALSYAMLEQLARKSPNFLEVMLEQYKAHGPERLLGKTPFFGFLSSEERRKIATQMEIVELKSGEVLFDYNERSNLDLYVVQGGLLSVSAREDGRDQYLNTAKPGNVVGEMGVPQNTRKFRAHAVSDARLMRWPEALYREFYMKNQTLRQQLFDRQEEVNKKLRGYS